MVIRFKESVRVRVWGRELSNFRKGEVHAVPTAVAGVLLAPWLVDLPAMRHAVLTACGSAGTRDLGYALANRIFSSLYTSMRTRDVR